MIETGYFDEPDDLRDAVAPCVVIGYRAARFIRGSVNNPN